VRRRVVRGKRQWVLGRKIGSGGYGDVFLARSSTSSTAKYAVKLIPIAPGSDRELLFVERLAIASSRNVVPQLDSGDYRGYIFIVMPLADYSLEHTLQVSGSLPIQQVEEVARDIATALSDIQTEVVHRDIKPGNILFLDGRWQLSDFGIARYVASATAPETRKHSLSPEYSAPERWQHGTATVASDIYSLGITLYECLTGDVPFVGKEFDDFGRQHLHDVAPQVTTTGSSLSSIISRCLYKSATERPTPEQILFDLANVASGHPIIETLVSAENKTVKHSSVRIARIAASQSGESTRAQLAIDGMSQFHALIQELATTVACSSPSARISEGSDGSWEVILGSARLAISRPLHHALNTNSVLPDVVLSATATVIATGEKTLRYSYALWYCNPDTKYRWHEITFVGLFNLSNERPSALPPGPEAEEAFRGSLSWRLAQPLHLVETPHSFARAWADRLGRAVLEYPSE